MRDRLTRFDRARLAYGVHALEGRWLDALEALRDVEQLDPQNRVTNYLIGMSAVRLNRPQETLDEYAKLNAETWNTSAVGGWRYARLTEANHLLGRHDEELRIVTTAKGLFPTSLATRNNELGALAALGRFDDLRRSVDDLLALTVLSTGTPGARCEWRRKSCGLTAIGRNRSNLRREHSPGIAIDRRKSRPPPCLDWPWRKRYTWQSNGLKPERLWRRC